MIDKYKLVTSNRDALIQQLDVMLGLHKEIEINARPWKSKRSLSQNNLYWQFLKEIASQVQVNHLYFEAETWHEYFKKYWCPEKRVTMPAGEDLFVKSTTKLDTGEMHFYLNRIEQWAMEKMISLTIPDSSEYAQLKRKQDL